MALEYTDFRVLAATAAGKTPGRNPHCSRPWARRCSRLSELDDGNRRRDGVGPQHEGGELGHGRYAHAMPRYCFFSRAATTIYGGSDGKKNITSQDASGQRRI